MNYNNRLNHSFCSSLSARSRKGFLLILFALLLFCFCFFSCSQDDNGQELSDGTAVSFVLSGIASEVTQQGTTRAALDQGTGVVVLAYRTGAQSTSNYVGAVKYIVQANGSLIVASGNTEFRLIDGTYDFYAYSPAAGISVDVNGANPTLPHGMDFAVSLTTGKKVTKWSAAEGSSVKRSIVLNELTRKCAKINFAIDIDNNVAPTITDTKIVEAVLSNMPSSPQTATGTTLPASSGTTKVTLASDQFTTNVVNPRKASGSTILLPKTSSTFSLSIKAQFNGVTGVTTSFPATNLLAMPFDSGKEYWFTVRLTKNKFGNTSAGLWVTVSKWSTSDQDYNLGGLPAGPVDARLIGEWKNITWGDVGVGGGSEPIITGVSGWWNYIEYIPEMGNDYEEDNT